MKKVALSNMKDDLSSFFRLEERSRDLDQTAFFAFHRMDSDATQAAALKVLLQA